MSNPYDQRPQPNGAGPTIPRWVWLIVAIVVLNVLARVFHLGITFF